MIYARSVNIRAPKIIDCMIYSGTSSTLLFTYLFCLSYAAASSAEYYSRVRVVCCVCAY